MAAASSLLFSREPGIYRNNGYFVQPKSTMDKGQLHSISITLSSSYSRQDAWSLHLLNSAYVSSSLTQTRCSVCLCQAVLKPDGGHGIHILKTASAILMRSHDGLPGIPLVLQLVPALGIISFAVWGFGPLMHLGRSLFLHKNDNNWQKSSTHYVLTSYLQPLLLWSGATLLCRALDPVILPSVASQAVKHRLLNFVRSLSTVMAFAYCLSSLIQQTQKFFVETKDSSDARNVGFEFAGKAVYTAVWVAALSLFMELVGFSTQKWLTAGGLGTVLLTLAGREIFTNFLSSIMIHATRPFILNDWIQTKIEGYEVSGTVEHVGWWSPTVIRGDDREAVHIPNHKFTVTVVRNLSQKTHWRIKTHLAISHLDVIKINNIVADMRKVLAKNPQVEQQKLHRRVFLDNIDPENQALLILVSCFVKTSRFEEYMCVKEAILLDLLRVISHHRARLATPIRTVQKVYREPDLDESPFADTIFSGTRPVANRPVLLIEPSYKINGEDKTKASTHSVQSGEQKDAKVDPSTISDATGSTSNIDGEKKENNPVSGNNSANSKVKVDRTSLSDGDANMPTTTGSSDSVQSKSETQHANEVVADELLGRKPTKSKDTATAEAATGKQLLTSNELGGNKDVSSTSQGKLDGERTTSPSPVARPVLEDNIVLGVALEGSKRTLPIEEEMSPSPILTEPKELATSRNGNGSTAASTDTKDDQSAAIPSATSNDQREK